MTAPTRRIAVASVSRSDYDHLHPVLEAIRDTPGLDLRLLVAGAHLAPAFGATVRQIEQDGWPIAERLDVLEPDDGPEAVARSLGRAVAAFAGAHARQRPDVVVVLGDRFEMLAAALAALPFALPVAHVHGGEVTEGAMDNQIRHALTKLAHVHFASAPAHVENLRRLGEEPWRIHLTGAPGLDRLRARPPVARAAVAQELGLSADDRWLLVTFHPVTLEHGDTDAHLDALLAAVDKLDASLVVTYPGADTHGRRIIERLEAFARPRPRVRLVPSLGERLYLALLEHADAMVGNSSSALIEAPSFGLPAVNVGARQRGRLRGANVIDVAPTAEAIGDGLARALAPGLRDRLRQAPNPYGDGRAAPRIAAVLREVPLDARLVAKRGVGEAGAPR
jgi:UDP-hydrolysing UDP-N-acetyl-D-glucosamine 2-epimerase